MHFQKKIWGLFNFGNTAVYTKQDRLTTQFVSCCALFKTVPFGTAVPDVPNATLLRS